MSKRQRGNKEAKKPKKAVVAAVPPVAPSTPLPIAPHPRTGK